MRVNDVFGFCLCFDVFNYREKCVAMETLLIKIISESVQCNYNLLMPQIKYVFMQQVKVVWV